MHQLANAVIIFDEIQTIPLRVIHLFNNAVNFLTRQGPCNSTVVFCTATQPILHKVDQAKGAAIFSSEPEMTPSVNKLFEDLRRVEIVDNRKPGGWTADEIADQAIGILDNSSSVLIVVNTKAAARQVYEHCRQKTKERVFHLSTNMCPAHRMDVLKEVKERLDPPNAMPVICVSTQLIEAGVDVDFTTVVRYMAGLDSIAQAAGRCNRNGLRKCGNVFIVNPACENLDRLPDIRIAKEKAERVLDEYRSNPSDFDNDRISPKAMERYYQYYFFERASDMVYPLSRTQIGRDDNLLSLLSTNALSVEAYKRANKKAPPYYLRQSFKVAAEAFQAIDAPTEGIIVPYGAEGKRMIADLCAAREVQKQYDLLKKAQRYSVNVFPNVLRKLLEHCCIREVQEGSGVMYLDERYYSPEFGVSFGRVEELGFLNA